MPRPFIEEARDFLTSAGYVSQNIVPNCAFTSRSDNGYLRPGSVELAAFAAAPHDMRSACVVAFNAAGSVPDKLGELRYLAAPVALVAQPKTVELWQVATTVPQHPIDVFDRREWTGRLASRLDDLSPASITSAKQGQRRIEYVDGSLWLWTKQIASESLKRLLEDLIQSGLGSLADRYQRNDDARSAVLRLVFHLFACRVLEDKGITDKADTAHDALNQANRRFSENIRPDVLDSHFITKHLAESVFHRLRSEFSFDTVTTELLAHTYENTLITETMRKRLGVYYTPRYLTEYILRRLPIEAVPQDRRFLWDPCCGCGSFLLAGFERLSSLLPTDWTAERRHKYLRERVFGSDVDEFAAELASLALVLTDLHNQNGWAVKRLDAINVVAQDIPRQPTIIVTNLPFNEIKVAGKRRELAADILKRLIGLSADNALFGIVLPQSFLDSSAAFSARRSLLDHCDVLEVGLFPGGLFESQAETAVLLLRRRSTTHKISVSTVRELRSADLKKFVTAGAFTRTYPANPQDWVKDKLAKIGVSPLSDLWKELEARHPTLGDAALIKNGIQLKTDDSDSVSEKRSSQCNKPYVDRLSVLRPFALLAGAGGLPTKWIKYGPQLHRPRDERIFKGKKVLINSNRNPGSAWRIVAAMSREDLYFSENFHAVIPQGSVSIEQITAVLNSPLANAWFDSHCRKRKVVQVTLRRLPFPIFSEEIGMEIDRLVKKLEKAVIGKWKKASDGMFYDGMIETGNTAEFTMQIDGLVYDAYGLSLEARRHVDVLMSTDKRPG